MGLKEFKKYFDTTDNDILEELYVIYQENGYEWLYGIPLEEAKYYIYILNDEKEAVDCFQADLQNNDFSEIEQIYSVRYASGKIIVITY